MPKGFRIYQGNLDGRNDGLIAARSMKHAAELLRLSLYEFRQFWSATDNPEVINVAMSAPCHLFIRPMVSRGPWQILER